MTNTRNSMTQIKCLVEYLRTICYALSYSDYHCPERIVSLIWAKKPVEIISNSEQLEQELSDAIAIPEMGEDISLLFTCLNIIVQGHHPLSSLDTEFYDYNDYALREGYQGQWDIYEKQITKQEAVLDKLKAQVAALEAGQTDNDVTMPSLELRLKNRKQSIEHEQNKLDELYTIQNSINDYLQIIDSCYKPALDEIVRQCRELLPIVNPYYEQWELANPKKEEPKPQNQNWPSYDEWVKKQKAKSEAKTAGTGHVETNPCQDFFSPSLIIQIYELCNGNQFEECNSTTFIDAINLRTTGTTLRIKNKEKVRVCYLINSLWRILPKDSREEWLSRMLDILSISRKFYNSKYSISPKEYERSKATNIFYNELNDIISTTIH